MSDRHPALGTANVYSVGETGLQYEITTTATNRTEATVTFGQAAPPSLEAAVATIRAAQTELQRNLGDLRVVPGQDRALVVSSSVINPTLVANVLKKAFPQATVSEPQIDEVVSNAIRDTFEGLLQVQENLEPTIVSVERITEQTVDTYPELIEFMGGARIETTIGNPASLQAIDRRLRDLQFKPDTQDLALYTYQVFGPGLKPVEPNQPLNAFTYVSVAPEAGLRELSEEEWERYIENEKARVVAAAELETSLPRVTQIDPFIGGEQKQRALVAIFLSLVAIIGYVWLRFGSVRYGLAAIAALVHDVTIALGAVVACTYLAGTPVGDFILIQDFKISLVVIAAFLTLIGYSLNDTIVVFDRIRENRRRAQLTPQTITNSINQTISRTVMTSLTTFVVVLIMYIFGGPGLRGFTFAIGIGIIIGTYSSVAIAAPLLLVGRAGDQAAATAAANRRAQVNV
jgi:SecD/SecF fusion protein